MKPSSRHRRERTPLGDFVGDRSGVVSIELIVAIPLLIIAIVLSVTLFLAFKSQRLSTAAAYTVSDYLSRETDPVGAPYLERMNDIFDYLTASSWETRLRFSVFSRDLQSDELVLLWSYGTRELPPLTMDALLAQAAGQSVPPPSGDTIFDSRPVARYLDRLPIILPAETTIVVESIAAWESPFPAIVPNRRIEGMVVFRPRFSPVLNFEGPIDGSNDFEDPTEPPPPDPVDPLDQPPITVPSEIVAMTFDGSGPYAGWSTSSAMTGSGGLSFLGRFANETRTAPLTFTTQLPPGTGRVQITFDLMVLDDWQGFYHTSGNPHGDTLTMMVNGAPIAIDAFDRGASRYYPNNRQHTGGIDAMAYQVALVRAAYGSNFAGGSDHDERWQATITLTNPPQTLVLGFSAALSGEIAKRSFGIDNFRIVAEGGTFPSPYYSSPSSLILGTHPQTRFPVYAGCPNPLFRGPTISVRQSDLGDTLEPGRQLSTGLTPNADCPDTPGEGVFNASPTYVVRYDNQGNTSSGHRLRFEFRDTSPQCYAILIRDPNGQWLYNADKVPRFNLGYAPSGDYHIFMGTRTEGTSCDARMQIRRQ